MTLMKQWKTYRIHCRLLLLLIGGLCNSLSLLAVIPDKYLQYIDSLQHLLSTSSDPHATIPLLWHLGELYNQEPEQVVLMKRQLSEALRIDSIPAAYDALGILVQYYYNANGNRDSMLYWNYVIDSIASNRNEHPDVWFETKSLLAQDLLWSKNYEMAMSAALDLYRKAKELGIGYGMARCSETLGLVYQRLRRDQDAVVVFENALEQLEPYKEKLESKIRVASYQAESSVRTNRFEQTAKILARYKAYIDEQSERNRTQGEVVFVEREYWLLYCFYTDLYLRENKMDKAKMALNMASRFAGNIILEGDYAENTYLAVEARYYKRAGNIPKALQLLNQLLETERLPEDLQFKADILKEQGDLKGAFILYDEIYNIISQKNSETFFRQLNQLQTLHDLYDKEQQARELQISNQRMNQKQRQLYISIFTTVVLCLILYVLFVYYHHARRLKNELQHEKESLLDSEKQLSQEKEKAEEASRMKSAFLANMSHEIRTPLNAIVGFSGLLVDASTEPGERAEFTSIIHNNTELLLNLVNDVLDLSRMETGDLNFKLDYYLLADCCQRALDSVRHRIPEQVKLTYSPDPHPISVYTDPLRLQQLLTNLLTNAAKFTQEGEINLSYRLEAGGNTVRIAVTDTGCGIPPEKQATVFKRFEKLDDYKPGAGLGLSICSIIAEHLGGDIFVDAAYTAGARFVFIHPYRMKSSDA